MNGIRMDCKAVADGIKDSVAKRAAVFTEKHGRRPSLRIITAGDDEASRVYVRNKIRDCTQCGIDAVQVLIAPGEGCARAIYRTIGEANHDDDIDGIIAQLPLPDGISPVTVAEAIDPMKDVDCISPHNTWRLYTGMPYIEPCTPAGIMRTMESYGLVIPGTNAVVVGRSMIVGKPMAMMLEREGMTVTLCHSKTPWYRLAHALEVADVVVSAVGKPGVVRSMMLENKPTVFDVGITRGADGKLHGDCDGDIEKYASYYTTVPGGVGLTTRAMLVSNLMDLAEVRVDD